MESFEGKLAVVTGGGTGMGRQLVIQLAEAGAAVAACDVNLDTLAETEQLANAARPGQAAITVHPCDVSDETQVERFRDEVLAAHGTDHIHLLFNNAGIGGGGSFLEAPREEWDRTFGVTWGGVYHCSRAFLPLLVAADEGVIVNTSSVNGFWAALGPDIAHTAYSTAKFAVKGFTEALQTDLRLHAPHVSAVLVMPGHIGTDIVLNSFKVHGGAEAGFSSRLAEAGIDDPDQVADMIEMMGSSFRDTAPVSAAEAATMMLDAVREGRWRVLLGEDAKFLDQHVRANPETVYGADAIGPANFASAD
jgi:NAD(P)-dependent dehydrogenase (short-subunit alcohol dehydrogenase family)